jgi:hypothetical protein
VSVQLQNAFCNSTSLFSICGPGLSLSSNESQYMLNCVISGCVTCISTNNCPLCGSGLNLKSSSSQCFYNFSISNCELRTSTLTCSISNSGLTLATNVSHYLFNCPIAGCRVCLRVHHARQAASSTVTFAPSIVPTPTAIPATPRWHVPHVLPAHSSNPCLAEFRKRLNNRMHGLQHNNKYLFSLQFSSHSQAVPSVSLIAQFRTIPYATRLWYPIKHDQIWY